MPIPDNVQTFLNNEIGQKDTAASVFDSDLAQVTTHDDDRVTVVVKFDPASYSTGSEIGDIEAAELDAVGAANQMRTYGADRVLLNSEGTLPSVRGVFPAPPWN